MICLRKQTKAKIKKMRGMSPKGRQLGRNQEDTIKVNLLIEPTRICK